MARFNIDFLGNRKIMFTISAVLLAVSIAAVAFQGGLNFGIEFVGGTSIDVADAQGVTESQVMEALEALEIDHSSFESFSASDSGRTDGFTIGTRETDPVATSEDVGRLSEELGLPSSSFKMTVIGPSWGGDITRSSALAFLVSLGAIIAYMAVRFEWKMSIAAIVALLHDIVIVVGVYALSGREVTPNTIAALLTILGYSLYDTVVVFHRIKDNAESMGKVRFMDMANRSINEVFMRTINTTVSSLIPVLCLLFLGGETLMDFAFAMSVGLIVGSYSSFAVASPLFVLWKEREPKYAALRRRSE